MSTTASHTTGSTRVSKRSDEESCSDTIIAILEAQTVPGGSEHGEVADRDDEEGDIKDGGKQGWICVIGSWFALFSTFGWLNSMGLFQTYYSLTLLPSHSASTISWIFTTQLFLMWTCGLFYGRLIDVYGTKHIAIPCTILCTFCVAMLALSNTYVQIFMSQGIGFGLGASGLFTCGVVSTGQWFTKRKALAMGIVLSGSSVGGVVHTAYLHVLIQLIGFKWAVLAGALVVGVSGGVSCVLMRGRYSRGIWDRDVPWVEWGLFKQKVFVVYCLGTWLVIWGLFSTWNYLPTMSLRHGFSDNLSIYTIVVLNAGSVFGRILPSYVADRYLGRFNSITIISLLNAILLLAFWLPLEYHMTSTHAQIFGLSAVAGFTTGAAISALLPCVAELGSAERLGRRLGIFMAVIGGASLTSLPIQGALIPRGDGGFAYLIIFSGCSILVGTVGIAYARWLRVAWQWRG